MSRWHMERESDFYVFVNETDSYNEYEMHHLKDIHNADCDAYEARIAELEARDNIRTFAEQEARIAELEAVKSEYETECYALRAVTAEANADILRKRNKKLIAELARVKAESLRVVPDGEAVTMFQLDGNDKFIEHNGERYYKSGCSYICVNTDAYACMDDDTIVQPVRLEKWETEI